MNEVYGGSFTIASGCSIQRFYDSAGPNRDRIDAGITMSHTKGQPGRINWVDLTVPSAADIMRFYREVVGWTTSEVDMGGYADWCMNAPADGESVAGVCHARGTNIDLPPVWLIYINVADLDESIERCRQLGGTVKAGPKGVPSQGRYCVIQDPAGAYAALFEPPGPAAA